MIKPIAILLVFLFLSCQGENIFYILDNEEKIEELGNFPKEGAAREILEFSGYLVVLGKKLWYSAGGDTYWRVYPLPSGYSRSAVVQSATVYGGSLYFSVSDLDSQGLVGLYRLDSPLGTPVLLQKYEGTDRGDSYFQFYELTLFDTGHVARVTRTHRIPGSDSSSVVATELFTLTPTGLGASVPLPALKNPFVIKDMVDGGNYFILLETGRETIDTYSSGRVFQGTSDITPSATFGRMAYNALFWDGSTLYVSTRTGGKTHPILYYSGGSWNKIVGSEVTNRQFSSFEPADPIAANTIIVGTRGDTNRSDRSYYRGNGYYEINTQTKSLRGNTIASGGNYNSTNLRDTTIMDIYIDAPRDRVYIGTWSEGLWNNRLNQEGLRVWAQE